MGVEGSGGIPLKVAIIIMLAVAASVSSYASPCHYRHDGPALLPDPHCTPGAIIKSENPCAASFRTGEVRNVPESVKRKVYAEYGTAEKRGTCCEIDHLISLEIQGSNDIENLWPEPYLPLPGAHQKDVLENALHKEACSGTITLQQAQREISTDWYAAYTSLEAKGKLK